MSRTLCSLRCLLAVLLALLACCPSVQEIIYAGPAVAPWHNTTLQGMEQRAAAAVWQANLDRSTAVIHPSKAYGGVWFRDSFWSFLGLGDAGLALQALAHFQADQLSTGQLPTQFEVFLRNPLYKTDESTLLYVIWAAWQNQQHRPVTCSNCLQRALSYIRQHAQGGLYISQQGSYASWFDGFILKSNDTLSYNQGLYATALLAAQQLHLNISTAEVEAALSGYRALADHQQHYLRFSRLLPYHDISGLMGDFLATWLFHRQLLDSATVQATLQKQPAFDGGFKVVTDAQGHALPARAFVAHFLPGDYQNGGSWLLFDYVALGDGCLRGVAGACAGMATRLGTEFKHGAVFHEYLNTNPRSSLFGSEAAYRDVFSWDTFILRVDTVLTSRLH